MRNANIFKVSRLGAMIVLCASALLSFQLQARPSASGNIISWPNDAWYQVQDAQTYDIICQGGRQCEVPDGIYWVSWFDFDGSGGGGTRIVIGTPEVLTLNNETFANTISIDEMTISWSVAGWYQVQEASTYETICNGDDQCTVTPGRYVVVNHSVGLRATVSVPVSTDGRYPNGITFDEDTLSWPDDGWYQVQHALTYEAVCNGGTECRVASGSYIVINHDSGIRTEVEVSNSAVEVVDEVEAREVPRPSVQKLLGYSCTAEEFFFNRPPAEENIVGIEVMREGVVLGVTEGTSFFTDTRPLGVAQRYDFTAIRADGARSETIPYGTKSRC